MSASLIAETKTKFLMQLIRVQNLHTCPVCSRLFQNPVTLIDCMHSMCCRHEPNKLQSCPRCNSKILSTFLDDELKESTSAVTKILNENKADIEALQSLYGQDRSSRIEDLPLDNNERSAEANDSKKKCDLIYTKTINQDATNPNRPVVKEDVSLNNLKSKTNKSSINKSQNDPLIDNKIEVNMLELKKQPRLRQRTVSKDEITVTEKSKTLKVNTSQQDINRDLLQNQNGPVKDAVQQKRPRNLRQRTVSRDQTTLTQGNSNKNMSQKETNVFEIHSVDDTKTSSETKLENKTDKEDWSKTGSDINNSYNTSQEKRKKKKNDIEKPNQKGETKLQVACRVGNVEEVKRLIALNAKINTKDNAGWTPLHEAVQGGKLDIVEILLYNGAYSDTPGWENETPLHEAVRYNYLNIAKILVEYRADLNKRNCKGETPLSLSKGEMRETLLKTAKKIESGKNLLDVSCSEIDEDPEEFVVFCISSDKQIYNRLKKLSSCHENYRVSQDLTSKITHLVLDIEQNGICLRRLEILQAIVNGAWVVSTDWIKNSTEKELAPSKLYEVTGIGNLNVAGPKIARINKFKKLPGLFNSCYFYVQEIKKKLVVSKSLVLTRQILMNLIRDAEGTILRRPPDPESIPETERKVPYHAKKGSALENCSHYIIYCDNFEPKYNMSHIKALPVLWLLECIENFSLVDP